MIDVMKNKRGLIIGVANDHSIAWGIAEACARAGADLAFTYQNDAVYKRVAPLAERVGGSWLEPCDVSKEEDLDRVFERAKKEWGRLDFVLHAVAYSNKEELKGRYVDTSLENFLNTMHISCYSFTAVARRAAEIMPEGGSMLTLTYLGAERVVPHYNVMGVAKAALEASVRYMAADFGQSGIRVNGLSAGPMRTLAGSAIGQARQTFKMVETSSPLRRNVGLEELGRSGLYLLSDLSSAVTGEVHYVDCGYNVLAMPPAHVMEQISEKG